MRWLFLILLTANLVYFGWALNMQTDLDLKNAAAVTPVPSGARRLTLVRELKSPPPIREQSVSPGEEPGEILAPMPQELVTRLPDINVSNLAAESVDDTCLTFGPLPDEKQTVSLEDWFRSRRAVVHRRTTDTNDKALFWIYLAPKDSAADAVAVMDELKKKGISDYRLISQGDLKNAVSLGLYSSQAAVNERLAELQQHGYKPVVVPYTGANQVFWLDVKVPAHSIALSEVYQDLPSHFNSVPVKCDQIAMSADSQ